MYTSETAVYADAEGNIVPEDSPDAAFLVVAAGGTITDEEAAKYGLTDEQSARPEKESTDAAGTEQQAPAGAKTPKK